MLIRQELFSSFLASKVKLSGQGLGWHYAIVISDVLLGPIVQQNRIISLIAHVALF